MIAAVQSNLTLHISQSENNGDNNVHVMVMSRDVIDYGDMMVETILFNSNVMNDYYSDAECSDYNYCDGGDYKNGHVMTIITVTMLATW